MNLDEGKKPSFVRRMLDAIYSVWPRTDETVGYRALSRFRLKAEDITDGELSEDIINAAELFEEAFKIAKQRIVTANKLEAIESDMRDMESFGRLTKEEADKIKNLLQSFLSVTEDRNVLRYQLIDFDKGVEAMNRLETTAVSTLPKMQEAEQMQRIYQHDVGCIEGEKADLEHEREVLLSGMSFINKCAIGAVALLAVSTLVLGYLFLLLEKNIFYPVTILVLVAIIIMSVIYVFRREVSYELKWNAKKQARAVELLNKKVAVLAHYINFLNFTYSKYKVKNSQMLKNNLLEYEKYKHVTGRLDTIRVVMYETEQMIEEFLREKKINSGRFSVEQFAKNIDIDDKQKYYKELEAQKNLLDSKLLDFDSKHKGIWELLEEIKTQDKSPERIMDTLMQLYFEETENYLQRISKREIEKDVNGLLKNESKRSREDEKGT